MDFSNLTAVSTRLRNAVRTLIPNARADYWPNNLVIFAKTFAMGVMDALLRAKWVYNQRFIATADELDLLAHGDEIGVTRLAAGFATGNASFTTTGAISLAAGTEFVADSGAFFLSTSAVSASGAGSLTIPLQAKEAGVAGNQPINASVRPVALLSALPNSGAFAQGASGGTDIEDLEIYRARLLERTRARLRGGTKEDYQYWVRLSPVFNAAFVRGWLPSAGRVTVYALKPGAGAARIPTTGELEALAAHLEPYRPLCAEIVLGQAVAQTINISISGLDPDTVAVRAEVLAELADVFDERSAVSLPGENDTFLTAWINEAISRAVGENGHTLVSPASNVSLPTGALPVLGTLTFG